MKKDAKSLATLADGGVWIWNIVADRLAAATGVLQTLQNLPAGCAQREQPLPTTVASVGLLRFLLRLPLGGEQTARRAAGFGWLDGRSFRWFLDHGWGFG